MKFRRIFPALFWTLFWHNGCMSELFSNVYPKYGDLPLLNRKGIFYKDKRYHIDISFENMLYVYPKYHHNRFSSFAGKQRYSLMASSYMSMVLIYSNWVFRARRVTIFEHPYVVSVRWTLTHCIPGTIISRTTVITTAYPLQNVPTYEMFVVAGETYMNRGTHLKTVLFNIVHRGFNPNTLENNISLLRLYRPFEFRYSMKPIKIQSTMQSLSGKMALVTGWGRCDFTGSELCLWRSNSIYKGELTDPMLRTATFQITEPQYYCEGYKKQGVSLYKGMLCVGVAREEDATSQCMAVPGAPLTVDGALIGILSWGLGCGYTRDLPLVYTDVRYYYSWIIKVLATIDKINSKDLFELSETYKAYRQYNVLKIIRPIEIGQMTLQEDLIPMDLDYHLCKIDAFVYDIRDFLNNNTLRKNKNELYAKLRELHNKSSTETSD